MKSWTDRFGEGFVFSRYTLLWLMRQAIIVCEPDGVPISTRDHLESLGECCLIANDLAAFSTPRPLPTDLDVAANLLPHADYFSHEDYDREIARTLYLLTELAPKSEDTRYRTMAARIQELLGCSIQEHCDLAFGCAMKPLSADTADIENFRIPSLHATNFATTTVPVDAAQQFLTSVSSDESTFAARLAQERTPDADLTVFRMFPFIRIGEEFTPLDSGFVLDKAGTGLFWTALTRAASARERKDMLDRWSGLFEVYVNHVLLSNVPTQSRFIQNPRFSDGAEAFDACIVEHSTLLVFEHKASVIPSAIKYADKPEELRNILERRFVVGDGLRRQGLSQIFHSLTRFAEGDRLLDRTSDLPVEPKAIRKIMPVLVHLDNTLRTPAINHYMAGRFRALGRLKRYIVTPLVLMPITELEEIEGQLREHRMSEILESFLSLLRTDRTSVFLASILPILRGKLRDPGPTLQRFDQYMIGMSARLFPDETRSQN